MDDVLPLVLGVACAVAGLGWLAAARRAFALELELARANERLRLADEGQQAAAAALRAEAALSAQAVAEQLVQRAQQSFSAQDALTEQRLAAQLEPVASTLARFARQVEAMERARSEDSGGLRSQIAALLSASQSAQAEAARLSTALRRGTGTQGRWGEETLRNVLEAAGMSRWFDFDEQVALDGEDGRRRPDVLVRLPGGGVFVIDAKVSLTDFLQAEDTADESARSAALQRHAQCLRRHLHELASRDYQQQLERAPDFVALFVPGDGFLAAALQVQPGLLAEGLERRVLLVTPTTLFALCKAVAYGWRIEEQAAGAAQVAALGRELHKRLADLGGHAAALGQALGSAVGRFNAFVGSLESRVLPQARRFEELAVAREDRPIPAVEPVDLAVREPKPRGGAQPAAAHRPEDDRLSGRSTARGSSSHRDPIPSGAG